VFQGSQVVSIRLQDGTVYQFQPTATSATQCQQLVPPSTVDVTYVPIGTTPANASLSDSTGAGVGLLVLSTGGGFPGPVQLEDINTGLSYDPQAFTLTLPNGQQLNIDRTAGLTSTVDKNSNTLTFTASGILASPSGKSVTFARDAQNRITTITDPSGNKLTTPMTPTVTSQPSPTSWATSPRLHTMAPTTSFLSWTQVAISLSAMCTTIPAASSRSSTRLVT